MKKFILLALFLIFLIPPVSAEESIQDIVKNLYKEQKYDDIIKYADLSEEYPSEALYYIGLAFYMKSEDAKCLKYLDMCLQKDSLNSDAHFIKGKTYYYMSNLTEAINSIQKAIKIDSNRSIFYSGLGDVYEHKNELDTALKYYLISYDLEDTPDRTYFMLSQIYGNLNLSDKALEYSYIAKEKLSKKSDQYILVLYNIGLLQYLSGNYEKAEESLLELLSIKPDDYMSMPKLIQVYYAQKKYELAIPLKESLYKAREEGLLDQSMSFMFCFDQFKWEGKNIQVHERYDEPEGELYYKHLFYILDDENNIEYRIQTENSPILVSTDGGKYFLGMNKGETHYTFNVVFKEDFDYDELRQTVIAVLDGKLKPATSSKVSR